jgi:hypothetical protein
MSNAALTVIVGAMVWCGACGSSSRQANVPSHVDASLDARDARPASDRMRVDGSSADHAAVSDAALPVDHVVDAHPLHDADGSGAIDSASGHQADSGHDTSWCMTQPHAFCSDFDHGGLGEWSGTVETAGGHAMTATSESVSSPFALWSAIPKPSGVLSDGRVEKVFAPKPQRATLQFDLLLNDNRPAAEIAAGGWMEVASILQQSAMYRTGIKFMRGGSGGDHTTLCIRRRDLDCASAISITKGPPLVTGKWVHVALTYDFPPTSGSEAGSVHLEYDGVSVASYQYVVDPDRDAATSTSTILSVGLGTTGQGNAGQTQATETVSALYDNVTLDLVY